MEMREISDDYSYEKWIAILLLMLFLLPVLAHASPQEELETITLGADPSAIRAETTRIALSHHLVSASTSLVAVDTTPTDPAASRCTAQLLQLPEPLGSGHGDPLGQLPQTATSAGLLLLCGGVCLTLAAIMARKGL